MDAYILRSLDLPDDYVAVDVENYQGLIEILENSTKLIIKTSQYVNLRDLILEYFQTQNEIGDRQTRLGQLRREILELVAVSEGVDRDEPGAPPEQPATA